MKVLQAEPLRVNVYWSVGGRVRRLLFVCPILLSHWATTRRLFVYNRLFVKISSTYFFFFIIPIWDDTFFQVQMTDGGGLTGACYPHVLIALKFPTASYGGFFTYGVFPCFSCHQQVAM